MHSWIADRTRFFDSSGIRKVFDLAATMTDPINLSIGQPDFAVPEPIQNAAIEAIRSNKNGYALTQGMPVLLDKLQAQMDARYGHADRQVFITSGTSGGLVLAMMTLVNPGDEVIVFDPYFVMYTSLVGLAGGRVVLIDTYPEFRIDLNKLADAITPRTKAILFNSPANPTGVTASADDIQAIAQLAADRNIALVSDEIYSCFQYDEPFVSPARFNERTLVIDGFSKTYGITGWRVGFVHGPREIIQTMIKLQQYTFVCAPHPFQWASAAAMDFDMTPYLDDYRRKRDFVFESLKDDYEIEKPGGAFYIFPKSPWGTASEFVAKAIENQLLIIPGSIFSARDTHVRISYAASQRTLERGVEVLLKLARNC